LVKKLETRGSRSNACRLLSFGPIEGQSVQKYTPYNRTTPRRYTPRDLSRQHRHFGKSIPEFGETHSSVLGCEMRPVSASIISRSCFASFPVCVCQFSSHYLNNIIFIDNNLVSLFTESPRRTKYKQSSRRPIHFVFVYHGANVRNIQRVAKLTSH